jgi:hypothetical protein
MLGQLRNCDTKVVLLVEKAVGGEERQESR